MSKNRLKIRMLIAVMMLFFLGIFFVYFIFNRTLPDSLSLILGQEVNLDLPVFATATVKDEEDTFSKSVTVKGTNCGEYKIKVSLLGLLPVKQIDVKVSDVKYVYPSGVIEGIYMETEGVLVVKIEEVLDVSGRTVSPCKGMIKEGDYVYSIDGEVVHTKEDIKRIVDACEGRTMKLVIHRKDEEFSTEITPVKTGVVDGKAQYLIGIWVRNNIQGLGTVTYVDGENYAALGHAVNDVDTGLLLDVDHGSLYEATITKITKGQNSKPGAVQGAISYGDSFYLGDVQSNENEGIGGTLSEHGKDVLGRSCMMEHSVPIAYRQDVKEGKAMILSDISGEVRSYEIEITKTHPFSNKLVKGIEIKVTDPKLLEMTGGIIQGMSGSPIIQDGKLVGAVTHVFVDDPTKGYGIFIEEMMSETDDTSRK